MFVQFLLMFQTILFSVHHKHRSSDLMLLSNHLTCRATVACLAAAVPALPTLELKAALCLNLE